jgi:hypothetical protein
MIASSGVLALHMFWSLKSGLYQCPANPDICDQEVTVYRSGKQVTALKVEYVGYCGSMGPYLYPCSGSVCSDGNAEFRLNSKGGYHWRNLGYPYECDFRQK